MKKPIFTVLALMAVLSLMLSACGPTPTPVPPTKPPIATTAPPPTATPAPKPVKLTMWNKEAGEPLDW
ncbi:MAG: hypothetical protein AB1566_15465, partial [Chloroflexota bacterium]